MPTQLDKRYFDAFGKFQVSQDLVLLDVAQLSDDINQLLMTTGTLSGSGTSSVYDQNTASTRLSVSAGTAGHIVRRSRRYLHYQPAKGMSIMATGVFDDGKAGITQLIGLGDESDGVFFGVDETDIYVMIRSSVTGTPVEKKVYRENWNVNTLNNYSSQEIIDYTKTQIFRIDLEWLGVGSVRFAIYLKGVLIPVHEFYHANLDEDVYMRRASLPIWYSIEADGTNTEASTLKAICTSVASQGGQEETGITRYITRNATVFTTDNTLSIFPLLSIRLKSTHLWDTVYPVSVGVLSDSTPIEYEVLVILNPTVAGTDNAVWTPLLHSGIEYDKSRDLTNKLSGGYVLAGNIASQSNIAAINIALPLTNFFALGSAYDGTADELVIAVRPLHAKAATFHAEMTVRELF